MSAAAVKIPLAVKKAMKDKEPELKKELDGIKALVGFEPVMDFQLEKNFAALEGHSYQNDLPNDGYNYVVSLREGMANEFKDSMTKDAFLKQWTTKKITFTVEPESFNGADYAEKNVATWNSYNGLRIVNGDLDIYTKKDRFSNNTHHIAQIKYADLLKNAKGGDVPLQLAKEMRDEAKAIDAVKARIAKAVGLDKVDWDIVADAKAIDANPKRRSDSPFSMFIALAYMTSLAELLEKQCADEMVKEAVADVMSAKRISLKCYDDVNGLKGLETHCSYHGIQFLDGVLIVFARSDNFSCNTHNLSSEHNLVKLF